MIGNEKGNIGEKIAGAYLEKNGYKIIARNYHSLYGEIDIIAQKGDYIIFVEVKLRKNNSRVSPFQSVSLSKQKKIIKTSVLFLQENPSDLQPRYDVISVTAFGEDEFSVNHLKAAFDTQNMFY